MSNVTTLDENEHLVHEKPGAQLAAQRALMDYTPEYVASKLHLRVRIIELLEADDYQNMPEPVFIKGYIRAYAKLLGIPSEPLLDTFNRLYSGERKLEKALWQSRRETNKAEHVVRWLTTVFAVAVLVAVAMWWQANKENEHIFPANLKHAEVSSHNQSETEIRLTDLSKMRSLLSSTEQHAEAETDMEIKGG
ncbi:MAG: helix-turn-helix transcriptional regulator [Legionellaceae bacterium]|nr:helix-turn-helix transcriptional regulator [Legionellaceae bacterium]